MDFDDLIRTGWARHDRDTERLAEELEGIPPRSSIPSQH
jgi:hypothetical protein